MLRGKKFAHLKTRSLDYDELYFDEEFEEIEEDLKEIDGQFNEDSHSGAQTSSEISTSPQNDSAGDTLNTESSHLAGGDFSYDYEDDEDFSKDFDLHSFHESLASLRISKPKLFKNGTRASLTFSNERVREIERHNQLLLHKIMENGPSDEGFMENKSKPKTRKPATLRTSAEINRRRQQIKIDYENSILKKKLDKIALRRPRPSM